MITRRLCGVRNPNTGRGVHVLRRQYVVSTREFKWDVQGEVGAPPRHAVHGVGVAQVPAGQTQQVRSACVCIKPPQEELAVLSRTLRQWCGGAVRGRHGCHAKHHVPGTANAVGVVCFLGEGWLSEVPHLVQPIGRVEQDRPCPARPNTPCVPGCLRQQLAAPWHGTVWHGTVWHGTAWHGTGMPSRNRRNISAISSGSSRLEDPRRKEGRMHRSRGSETCPG